MTALRSHQTPMLQPVARIAEQARLHTSAALPADIRPSCPIPAGTARGAPQLLVFFCRIKFSDPPGEAAYWPPSYVAAHNAVTGRLESLKAVAPGDFGVRHPQDRALGNGRTPGQQFEAPALERLVRWQQALDAILPYFAARTYGLTPEQQRAAHEFVDLTPRVLEAPLMPWYQAAGREFFDWLKLVKR